jgi:hypothetical protein
MANLHSDQQHCLPMVHGAWRMVHLASFCKNSKLLPLGNMIDSFDKLIDCPFLVPERSALGFLGLRDFAKQDLVLKIHKAIKEIDLLQTLLAFWLFVGGGEGTHHALILFS